MINVTINGNKYECSENISVMDFLNSLGIDVPKACFVKNRTEGGRCMVCAVDIDGEIKASCCTNLKNGMDIKTDTLDVEKARAWAIRFLLAHHPPLCYSCHKLGECVLPIAQKKNGMEFKHKFKGSYEDILPETINNEVSMHIPKCIQCGQCDNRKAINRDTAAHCPTGALEIAE